MSVEQMAKHNTIWNKWVLGEGEHRYDQGFLGKIFGKMMLKVSTKDDQPIGRNAPAGAGFIVAEPDIDLSQQQAPWKNQVEAYAHFSNDAFVHDFFGKMTSEQIGIFAYKHNDHHLRQFGV